MPCLIIALSLCGKRMQLLPGWLRGKKLHKRQRGNALSGSVQKAQNPSSSVSSSLTHHSLCKMFSAHHFPLGSVKGYFLTCAVTVRVTVKQQLHCRARITCPLVCRLQAKQTKLVLTNIRG